MSRNRNAHRAFSAFALLLVLVFASLPAQAQPARRTVAASWKVAVAGEAAFAWVRRFFAGLWSQGTIKEGVLIDPNGALDDEGMTIDPNGHN